jgi:hypothetical protein
MNKKFFTILIAIMIVCFCAFPMAGMSNVRAGGIPPQAATVPTPISPSGTISDTTPTFTWTRISGSTQYQFEVFNGSSLAYPVVTVPVGACGSIATNCWNTPTTALSYAAHTWKVRAYVSGAWKGWSGSQSFLITNVPTPLAPTGLISDTPTFKWIVISGATQYQFAVYKGSTLKYTKVVTTSSCGSTTCSNTPTNVLTAGAYTWKVAAYVGGTWKAYSPNISFTITGFDSEFTNNSAGWTPLKGVWTVGSGFYKTDGVSNYWASSAHSNSYTIYTYEVKFKATGCTNCANVIFFNGVPLPIRKTGSDLGLWYSGYLFGVNNSGKFILAHFLGSVTDIDINWTTSSYVTGSWNTLKVTFNKSTDYAQLYINGHMVAHGHLNMSTSGGQVGVGFAKDSASSSNHQYVDYAKLSLTAPTASVPSESEGIVIGETMGPAVLPVTNGIIAP